MALWVIGYGAVQASAPALIRRKTSDGQMQPDGHTATWLAFVLAMLPAAIAAALHFQINATIAVTVGLILFGVVFALNSAVHSYLILAYTDHSKVAMNVGIYSMANACGRLAGTILSGLLYQIGVRSGINGGLVAPDGPWLVSSLTRQVVMIGILGGFTTFFSFSFQTLNLLNDGQWTRASVNIILSLALCLFAVWLGQAAAHAINHRHS